MNVGIMAGCLPTLKPLATDFFGAVSAFTYGSRGHTIRRSRPQASSGYLRQSEPSGRLSYNLDDLKAGPAEENRDIYRTGTVVYKAHGRRKSTVGMSDESVLPLQKGIIRTTEVEISQSRRTSVAAGST
jgi:hypothetical protein